MRTTKQAIAEAKKKLKEQLASVNPNVYYHKEFDDLLEERLMELEPEFMRAMYKEYKESGVSRWYE